MQNIIITGCSSGIGLESAKYLRDKPKPRYYITKAIYILGFMKRFLGTRGLDFILSKID